MFECVCVPQQASWSPVLWLRRAFIADHFSLAWVNFSLLVAPTYTDAKVANRTVRDFGWEIVHDAVSRRLPIPLSISPTKGYTYAPKVWDLSIVQGPFSVAPCQTLFVRFVTFASL